MSAILAQHVYRNTKYIYGMTRKEWGTILEWDTNNTKVRMASGEIVTFGTYEVYAWANEQVIIPVCGICGDSYVRLDCHLKMHMVDVHG